MRLNGRRSERRTVEGSPRGAVSRRAFVARCTAFFGAVALGGPAGRVAARAVAGPPGRWPDPDPGDELLPVADESTGLPLLALRPGFRYVSFGWTGDVQSDGSLTPALHDGMGAFDAGAGRVRLVRNHEVGSDRGNIGGPVYDEAAGGGTTTLEFDAREGRLAGSWPSLGGTIRNCAGGPTPWGSWLTCEETLAGPGRFNRLRRDHGFVFEVPAAGEAEAVALRGMGRFVHEAVAVDPATGIVYQTEDRGSAGFYRFIPHVPGRLEAGGRLQMLAVEDRPGFDTRRGQAARASYPVAWVDIDDPLRAHDAAGSLDGAGVFAQGRARGGAVFGRLEGAWWGNGRVFFVSTDGGDVREGQVWSYDPVERRLALVFESTAGEVLNNPDNVTVDPFGGMVLCEDGGGREYLHWLAPRGEITRIARNDVVLRGERNGLFGDFRGSEFAGATFSPAGDWLFVNIQVPGITFAITGPWRGPAR